MKRSWLLIACCLLNACTESEKHDSPVTNSVAKTPLFNDVASSVGLVFQHVNGMYGESLLTEIMGSGVALIDYDNDGDLDVFAVQGGALSPNDQGEVISDQLFRNLLMEDGVLAFENVTQSAGLGTSTGYGMGVATGDYNNDGWMDLYVTNYGVNRLWKNLGNGSFEDVTAVAGADGEGWSTSAAFFDLDADGWLDLYIANYLDYRKENNRYCRSQTGRRDYCSPANFDGASDIALVNQRDGTFSARPILSGDDGRPGLGVVTGDFNRDGVIDVYVANDLEWNFLWGWNDGKFVDIAMESGAAVNMDGRAEASMGVDAADVDNDGDEDLFSAHLRRETNTLYINNGSGVFEDASSLSGLGLPSTALTGFGVSIADFDNDAWLDVAVANGAVTIIEEQAARGLSLPLGEPNLLFMGMGQSARFSSVPASDAGHSFEKNLISRGIASGDVDNDGDIDLLISNNNGPLELLVNQQVPSDSHWIGIRVLGDESVGHRDMLGAHVTLRVSGRTDPYHRRVRTDGSYLSAREPRVHFGLGSDDRKIDIEIRWPDGSSEFFGELTSDTYHVVYKNFGKPVGR